MFVFNILSIFPEIIECFTKYSLINKAIEKNLIKFNFLNLRDYTKDKHRQIDDEPYGGGSGMVFKIEPVFNALSSLKTNERGKVVLLSAKGKKFTNSLAKKLSKEKALTLICCRYEGIDERISNFIDYEVSIGDYVLMGGEIPACVIIEAVSRLIPGVIGKEDSVKFESYEDIFLEYPHYTRPKNFNGLVVPEILLSGNHKEIEIWRKRKSIENTVNRRFDLIQNRKRPLDNFEVSEIKNLLKNKFEIYTGLVHFPVYNKKHEIVLTAITNMDIHDISRVSRTYGIKKYFLITPDVEQKAYALRIINHWKNGYGREYNPSRKEALKVIEIKESIEDAINEIKKITSKNLITIGTSAKKRENEITIQKLKELAKDNAIFLIFGTGWGLTEEILDSMDYILEPIYGLTDFNHLSVRSAVSVIVDRLMGF